MSKKKGGRKAAAQKQSEAQKAALAKQAAELRKKRIRNIVLIVVCVVLALSMTIPSVSLILSRDDTETTESGETVTSLVDISKGYEATYDDLKKQADKEGQDSYDATFQENYTTWVDALNSAAEEAEALDADDIAEAYKMVYDSIASVRDSSSDPDAYYKSLSYAYQGEIKALDAYSELSGSSAPAKSTAASNSAISFAKKALDYSYDVELANELAELQYDAGDTDDAIATEEKAVEEDPTNTDAWYNLAGYYSASSETEKVVSAYQQVLETDPDDELGYAEDAQSQIDSLNAELAESEAEDAAADTTAEESSSEEEESTGSEE